MARRKLNTVYIWGYTVILKALKRKSIYGERKIVALNTDESECSKAYLSENGTEVFPKGATASCKIDSDGNAYLKDRVSQDEEEAGLGETFCYRAIEREALRFSPEGREFDESGLASFCGEVTGVYTLEDLDQAALAEAIGTGIYHYDLQTGKGTIKTAMVFQRDGVVFLLTYEKGMSEPARRNAPPSLDDAPVFADLDQIDFEMF